MTLLNLPRAVIEAILCNLPATDLFHCLLVNKYLNEIITTSTRLELKTLIRKLANLGAEINPFSSFSASECLRILNESTQNWTTLTPDFVYSVDIPPEARNICDREGVLICFRENGTGISYMPLPRTKEESLSAAPKWHSVDLGVHHLISFNLFMYEHDLLAFVTSTLDIAGKNAQPEFNIYVRLRRFSIRGPHPRASTSDIFIMKSLVQKPHAMINIVGRHLILMVLLGHPLHPRHPLRGAYIYVYNWELGTLLMRFTAPASSYQSFIFLNEHLFLMANPHAFDGQLDVFRIPTEPDDSIKHAPIVALRLPSLSLESRFIIAEVSCGVNPIARKSWPEMRKRYTETTSAPRRYLAYERRTAGARPDSSIPLELDTFHSKRPFILKSEDALCVFSFATSGMAFVDTPDGMRVNTQKQIHQQFTMQVHRKALLRAVEQYAPKPTSSPHDPRQLDPLATFGPPSAGMGGSTILPQTIAFQNQVLPFPDAAPITRTAQWTPVPAIAVTWTQWGGPQVTRWFKTDNMGTNDLSISMGERCVRLSDEIRPPIDAASGCAPRMPVPYHMFDFNKYLCGKAVLREAVADQGPGDTHQESRSTPFASGVEGSGTDKAHESGEGDLATMPANGDSKGNQTTAPNDPAAEMAANSPSESSFTIPSYYTVGPYDKAVFIQSLAVQFGITPAQREEYARVTELAHAMLDKTLNSLDSDVFHPQVECQLPYRITTSDDTAGTVTWQNIMIDEERLMGFCQSHNDKGIIQTMEIHHFG